MPKLSQVTIVTITVMALLLIFVRINLIGGPEIQSFGALGLVVFCIIAVVVLAYLLFFKRD